MLEDEISNLPSIGSSPATTNRESDWEHIQPISREEVRIEAIKNNVILSGVSKRSQAAQRAL